jgi:hypothetical protein
MRKHCRYFFLSIVGRNSDTKFSGKFFYDHCCTSERTKPLRSDSLLFSGVKEALRNGGLGQVLKNFFNFNSIEIEGRQVKQDWRMEMASEGRCNTNKC